MDNGQHRQNLQDPFATSITSGVGTAPEIDNPSPDNLNTGAFENHDYSGIGNMALNVPMMPPGTSLETDLPSESLEHQLDQDIQLIPPHEEAKNHSANNDTQQLESIDPDLHFTDGKISPGDLAVIKDKVLKLSQDGNIADFYRDWQNTRKSARKAAMEEAA